MRSWCKVVTGARSNHSRVPLFWSDPLITGVKTGQIIPETPPSPRPRPSMSATCNTGSNRRHHQRHIMVSTSFKLILGRCKLRKTIIRSKIEMRLSSECFEYYSDGSFLWLLTCRLEIYHAMNTENNALITNNHMV